MFLRTVTIIGLSAGIAACGTSSSDDDTNGGNGGGGGGSIGVAAAQTLSDLGLSSALNLTIPDSVKGSNSSSLVSSRRSADACNIRNEVASSLAEIAQAGSMFCHLEVESDKFNFGEKTRVEFDMDLALAQGEDYEDFPESFQIWVDNSSSDRLTVYFCEDEVLVDRIDLTDAAEGRSAGSVIMRGSWNDQVYARSLSFDNNVTELGRTMLELRDTHEGPSDAFRRHVSLNLSDTGVSEVSISRGGSWQGDSFSDAGAARFSEDGGMAIFRGEGSHTHGGDTYEYEFSTRSAFDNLDLVVDPNSSEAFMEGGSLHVVRSDVPEILDSDFIIADFPEGSWNCQDTEVTITVNPMSEAHEACNVDWDELGWENCWDDDTFERGDEIE